MIISNRFTEVQELRHQDLGSNVLSASSSTLSTIIDQALVRLDERLETVAQNISLITSSLEALSDVPLTLETKSRQDNTALIVLRKHGTLLVEWESVQREAEILRDELKEDKWLLVFRTGKLVSSYEHARSHISVLSSERSGGWDDELSRANHGSVSS
jgi:hypothetical protein